MKAKTVHRVVFWAGISGVSLFTLMGIYYWHGGDYLDDPHFGLASWLTIGGANLAILAYLNAVKMFMHGKIKDALGPNRERVKFRLSLLGIPECLILLSSFCLLWNVLALAIEQHVCENLGWTIRPYHSIVPVTFFFLGCSSLLGAHFGLWFKASSKKSDSQG